MATPNVLILRAPGTNCDEEAQHAFQLAGAVADRVHINPTPREPSAPSPVPDPDAARGLQLRRRRRRPGRSSPTSSTAFLGDELRKFRDREKLILGVCNGFQSILKAGLLVPPDDDGPLATLTHNVRGYQDRWLYLKVTSRPRVHS